MLRVTIELVPIGFEMQRRTIGTIEIVNDGTGTAETGNYTVKFTKDPRIAKQPGTWIRGRVQGFPRKRLGPYDLLLRALAAVLGKRNSQ